jgi:hypothetical protein
VTLWFGALDNLSNVESPGINIQSREYAGVFAIADGIIAEGTNRNEGTVYVDFQFNGTHMQAVYRNMRLDSRFNIGDRIYQGEIIGQMNDHTVGTPGRTITRKTLVLELLQSENSESVNRGNSTRVDPALFFDLSPMTPDYLADVMVNFFDDHAEIYDRNPNNPNPRTEQQQRNDSGYGNNRDLEEGEFYLRRYIEYIYYSQNLAAEGLTIDDMLHWDDKNKISTAYIFGEVFLFVPLTMSEEQAINIYNERTSNARVLPVAAGSPLMAYISTVYAKDDENSDTSITVIPNKAPNDRSNVSVTRNTYANFYVPPNTEPVLRNMRIRRYAGLERNPFVFAESFQYGFENEPGDNIYTHNTYVDDFAAMHGFVRVDVRQQIKGTTIDEIHSYARQSGFEQKVREIGNRTVRTMTYSTNPATERVELYIGDWNLNGQHTLRTINDVSRVTRDTRELRDENPIVTINAGFLYNSYQDISMGFAYSDIYVPEGYVPDIYDDSSRYFERNNDSVDGFYGIYDGDRRFRTRENTNRLGSIFQPTGGHFQTLIYYSNGFSELDYSRNLTRNGIIEKIIEAERAGNPIVFIVNGTDENYDGGARSRSMIGVRADGSIILMSAYAGEYSGERFVPIFTMSSGSDIGIKIEDGFDILREMGAVRVLNLDGGGSTQFYYANYTEDSCDNWEECDNWESCDDCILPQGMVTPRLDNRGRSYRTVGSVIYVYEK